jgi:hypothetical protein
MFDTFMMRTRMESVLTAALQPAGIRSGDYAVVSLIAVEGSMTPATFARLLGVAPLVAGRTGGPALAVGWIQRGSSPSRRPKLGLVRSLQHRHQLVKREAGITRPAERRISR